MKKIFTLLIVTFPILSVYSTPITNLTIADMLMVIIFPILIFDYGRNLYKIRAGIVPLFIFSYYLAITLFIQIGMGTGVGVLSSIRYILYLIFLILSLRYFLFKYGMKVLEVITLVVSAYVIIQLVYFMAFTQTLPWYIPGLKVIDQNFILIEQSEFYLTFYRPTGIFLEPTHYAQFCVVYLVYLLFYDLKKNLHFIKAFLVTAGIIASGSSLGLIFLCFIWGVWFIKKQIKQLSPIKLILALSLSLITVSIVFSVDFFRYTIERMTSDGGFNGPAVGYRFDSLSLFLNGNIPFVNWIIGFGRSTNEVYFTGVFYIIYSNGILGLLIYLWICIDAAIRTRGFARWLIITALVLSIGSEFMANFGILYYLAFVFAEDKSKIITKTSYKFYKQKRVTILNQS